MNNLIVLRYTKKWIVHEIFYILCQNVWILLIYILKIIKFFF